MNHILIVIPVRGGSVGVPRKALRPLGNGPCCLERTLRTAQRIAGADVLVTSDDTEILEYANRSYIMWVREMLSDGCRPLDPIVWTAVQEVESGRAHYHLIVTMQCTSPFLRLETISCCIARAPAETVRDDRHPRLGGPLVPRQQLPPCWRITGGCLATPRRLLRPDSRRPDNLDQLTPIPVTGAEALDIDTEEDWILAEHYATCRDLVGLS